MSYKKKKNHPRPSSWPFILPQSVSQSSPSPFFVSSSFFLKIPLFRCKIPTALLAHRGPSTASLLNLLIFTLHFDLPTAYDVPSPQTRLVQRHRCLKRSSKVLWDQRLDGATAQDRPQGITASPDLRRILTPMDALGISVH